MPNKTVLKYLSKFLEQKLNLTQFIHLFIATLKVRSFTHFDVDLLEEFIYLSKSENLYSKLLVSINFDKEESTTHSKQLRDEILKLKDEGFGFTIKTQNENLFCIEENIPIRIIIPNHIDYLEDMMNFVEDFLEFSHLISDKSEKQKIK